MFFSFRQWLINLSSPRKRRPLIQCFRPRVEVLEPRNLPAPLLLTVTTAKDEMDGGTLKNPAGPDGKLSLREAILVADAQPANAGVVEINFAIGKGPATIQIDPALGPLPTITHSVIIDGTNQPGYSKNNFTPVITLDGSRLGAGNGLTITASNCTIQGLIIDGFKNGAGVEIDPAQIIPGNRPGLFTTVGGNGNELFNDIIGTNAKSSAGLGNGVGVFINGPGENIIGGASAFQRDVISGNTTDGVRILSINRNELKAAPQFNVVNGDYIGTNLSGTKALANGQDGVDILGGDENIIGGNSNQGGGNVIAGNGVVNVFISANNTKPTSFSLISFGNFVEGNLIGLAKDGTTPLNKQSGGVTITGGSQKNIIGGDTPGFGNVISGNANGVVISEDSTGNSVIGNYIGTARSGEKAVGNLNGVVIDNSSGNAIGGTAVADKNVISGNSFDGVTITGTNASGNPIVGNTIGLSATGANLGKGAQDIGVRIVNSPENQIIQNVISGNSTDGISITGGQATKNVVQANRIGTGLDGTSAVGSQGVGVYLSGAANGNSIGPGQSQDADLRNIISGNGVDGIVLFGGGTTANQIFYNYIGVDINGFDPVKNGTHGVLIENGASGNNLTGNVISASGKSGVAIYGANGTTLIENFIGTDEDGTTGVPNGAAGIYISNSRATEVLDNVVSANKGNGISIVSTSTGNKILANKIGLGSNGTTVLPNLKDGVYIDKGSTGNTIQQSTIQFNKGAGIRDANKPLSNTFTQNSIYENGALGIDDGPQGVTLVSIPLFTGVQVVGSDVILSGTLFKPQANTTYTIEYFDNDQPDPSGYGEGQIYLGSITVQTNGTANTNFYISIPKSEITGGYITATATDASGTSEFSAWIKAPTLPTITVLVSDPNPSTFGQEVYFLVGVVSQTTGAGTPTGPVEFFDGSQEIGVGQLAIVNGIDEASFSIATLAAGVHTITAEYEGDANFSPSTSAPLTQVVLAPTLTTVVSNLNPEYQGIPIQFTATVAPTSGTGTPTGTVQFVDTTTGTTLGTGTLAVDPTTGLDQASITTSDFAVGDNTIEVTYGGDSQFAGSAVTYVQDILPVTATTTTLVSSVNPTVTGQPNTFTVTVTANDPSFGVPSGQVDLDVVFSNGNILTVGTATLNAAGQAQIPINFLLPPGNTLFALYEGNYPFLVSESPLLNQVVNPADTTETLTAASSTVVAGQADNLSATLGIVPPGAAVVSPTGTATFWYSLDGGPATELAQLSIPGTGSIPAFTVPGTYQVWVTYSGDTNFNGSTSNTVTITVTSSGSSPSDPPWTLATNLPPAASLADPEVLAALLSHSGNTSS